jgi:hypothetical protein
VQLYAAFFPPTKRLVFLLYFVFWTSAFLCTKIALLYL